MIAVLVGWGIKEVEGSAGAVGFVGSSMGIVEGINGGSSDSVTVSVGSSVEG